MNSKVCFSKTLFVHNLRRYWWVSGLYALLTFFAVPFQLLTRDWSRTQLPEYMPTAMSMTDWVSNEVHMLMVIVAAVLTGALLFRFLMENRQTCFYHAAPFGKRALFVTQSVTAIVLIFVPVLLNALIALVFRSALSIEAYFSLLSIAKWLGVSLLVELVMLSSVIFVGMFTGSSIAQVVFTGILHVLPAGLIALLSNWFKMLLHGYTDMLLMNLSSNVLPVTRFINSGTYTPLEVLGYCVMTGVLFVLAYVFYLKRPLERGGDLITFKGVKPIFQYGVTACVVLLGVNYIGSVIDKAPAVWVYLLWGLLGYGVATMLMRKSFKILDAWKGFVGFTVIMLAVLGVLRFDLTGFERRVPDVDEVEEVLISDNYGDCHSFYGKRDLLNADPLCVFTEDEDLEAVKTLHETLAEQKEGAKGATYYIAYKLKNGRKLVRTYPFDFEEDQEELRPIITSEPYRESRFTVLTLDESKLEQIQLDGIFNSHKTMYVQGEDAARLLDALCRDLKERTYEQITASSIATVSLNVIYRNLDETEIPITNPSVLSTQAVQPFDLDDPQNRTRSFGYGINGSYRYTMEVLKELGLYEAFYPDAANFDRLEIYERDHQTGETIGEVTVIRDKDAINAFIQNDGGCLEPFGYRYYDVVDVTSYWWATLYTSEDKEELQLRLSKDSALPPEIMAYLNH